MAKKSKKIAKDPSNFASRAVASMKFKDLQMANVARGLAFQDAVNFDFHQHQSWLIRNQDRGQNLMLLNEFDNWMTEQLVSQGYESTDPINHPTLRLGYIPQLQDDNQEKPIRKPRGIALEKEPKKRAERLPGTKLLAGTKKALTYLLTKEGLSLPEIITKVTEAFPDANESSIKNWSKRCLKENK